MRVELTRREYQRLLDVLVQAGACWTFGDHDGSTAEVSLTGGALRLCESDDACWMTLDEASV